MAVPLVIIPFRLVFPAISQPFGGTPMTSHDYGTPHVMKSTATSPPGGKSVKGIGQGSDGLHHVMPGDYGGNVVEMWLKCG